MYTQAILIFPEGTNQAEPVLLPLDRGAARMALGAVRESGGKLAVAVVPVGLVFHRPETLRDGWGFAVVGPPVPFGDLVGGKDTVAAERELTSRIEQALRALILEARDRETLRLLEHAEAIAFGEQDLRALPPAERAAWRRRAIRAATVWYAKDRARVERLERDLEAHAAATEDLGLGDAALPPTYPGATSTACRAASRSQ